MGGCLTLGTVLFKKIHRLKGLVLSGPAINVHRDPNYSDVTRTLGKAVCGVLPKLVVADPVGIEEISRNEEACAAYEKDALNWHGGIRASIGNALIQLSIELDNRFDEIDLPMLILHGGEDKIISPTASETLAASKASPNKKKLIIYKNMKHELFEDPEKDVVFQNITDWLNTKMKE